MTLEERFWPKVKIGEPNECWEWQAYRHPNGGYGRFHISYKPRIIKNASQVVWELTYGPIPTGMFICHKCDNPPCCNPAHLFLGTPQDNSVDRNNKGRGYAAHCEEHPMAKLTKGLVTQIRSEYIPYKVPIRVLAQKYRMSEHQIYNVVHRIHWREI